MPRFRPSRTRPLILFLLSVPNIAGAAPPNVLFIAVDDMRVELGCYDQHWIRSPNIDRLAQRGLLFERAYCQQAVCNPSRASLLTGRRPHSLGIYDLPTHFRERFPEIVTLPQLFKNNGYHTQNIGKIFHNWRQEKYKGDSASWSVPAVMHYARHGDDKPAVEGHSPEDESNIPKCEILDVPDDAYFDGRIANLAVNALQEQGKTKDIPFFLAVGFWKPHAHFNAPKRYWNMYEVSDIQLPTNPNPPKDVPLIALHNSREILRAFSDRPNGIPTKRESRELRRGYFAAISYVDAQIGRVLDELERLDLQDDTIVVFWSDHGFHLGEHSLWAKTSNFELDARVPMIISLPGQSESQRTTAIVELLDIYPTLADLCGLETPDGLEGVSLKPLFNAPSSSVKHAALTQHPRPAYPAAGMEPEAMGYSMRTDRFRYTEWRDYQDGTVIARELYDHKTDSDETINLANAPNYSGHISRLADQLKLLIDSE